MVELISRGGATIIMPNWHYTTRRHNKLRDRLLKILKNQHYGLAVQREWCFPKDAHLPPNQRRRMDILIDDIIFAPKPQGLDITVVSPHSQPYVREKGKRPMWALQTSRDNQALHLRGTMHSIELSPRRSRTSSDRVRHLRFHRTKCGKRS